MNTCSDVDGVLLEYLEETLDGATRQAVEKHVASCVRCTSLLRDIDSIRDEAANLPELAPSRDLWDGIAERIEPAVVPFNRERQKVRRTWIPAAVAAAAALVITTAGITYIATSRSIQSSGQRVAVTPRLQPTIVEPAPETAAAAEPAPAAVEPAPAAEEPAPRTVRSSSPKVALASRAARYEASPTEIAYGDEISRLQKLITQRRNQLDPATVEIVEQNLKIIDAAVRQSRAALAKDPKSGFLTDQLNHALDKKVELLRTVALLPART